ncbi:uncharacterized protein BDV17DRAFT_295390 [Aspergillus undulatus]|uniref:uncharacterized protein n=1 Tax=Aspergillus undulatus TaxID=1810928 RepID=UPI003CCDEE1A
MPLDSQSSSKRAESPEKQPSLPPRPKAQDVESKAAAAERASSQQSQTISRPPSRTAAAQPTKTPSLSRQSSAAPDNITDTTEQTASQKGKLSSTAGEENQRLRAENVGSRKKLQELEKLLDEQRALNEEVISERDKAKAQAEENWKLWKNTARELRRIKQTPTHHQVTDSQLTGLIQQLKYAIRDFAVQYFKGVSRSRIPEDRFDIWNSYMVPTTPGTDAYQEYIKSPSRCASIIQAMLWRLLDDRVFGKFAWAGKAGDSLCDLRFYMKHAFRHEGFPDPELERKFQIWSAEATALVLQMCDFTEGSQEYKRVQNTRREIRDDFFSLADQYLATRSNAPVQDFRRILDTAMALDREIHRQAARINWEFLRPDARVGFEPKLMEVEKGQQRPKPTQPVLLVVAPGVTKRGRSDGQDFQAEEQLLVPMEVSCQLPSDIPATSTAKSKGPWFGF